MTREETKKIIGIVMASFPNWKPTDLALTLDTWQLMLEEFEYQQIAVALKSYVLSDTSGFAPSIGQLVQMVQKISVPDVPGELDAWASVSKAMRNSAYHSQEEFDALHPLVKKTIGTPQNLREMALDESLNIMVAQSNFIKNYRKVVESDKEFQRMPVEVRTLIETTLEQLRIGGK